MILPTWPAWAGWLADALVVPPCWLLVDVPSGAWPISWVHGSLACGLGLALPLTLALPYANLPMTILLAIVALLNYLDRQVIFSLLPLLRAAQHVLEFHHLKGA